MHTIRTTAAGVEYEYLDLRAPWEPLGGRLPIVFQHGIGLDRRTWDPWVRRLGSEFPIVAIDLRGHGGSAAAWRDAEYAVSRFADDILEVLDDCGIEQAHLVGESFGGTACAALACAVGERRVASVTTCSTAWMGTWVDNVAHWADLVAEPAGLRRWSHELADARVDPDRVPPTLHEWVVATQSRTRAEVVVGIRDSLLATNLQERMPGLRVPVLNLVGDSPFVDARSAQELVALVPHAQNVFIPRARHGIVLSHWAECCEATTAFLRRTERARHDPGEPAGSSGPGDSRR